MNIDPYVFDVDHVAKIRSELSITLLEEKKKNKSDLSEQLYLYRFFFLIFFKTLFLYQSN